MAVVLDLLLAIAFALTALAGFRNGFFRELFALLGLVVGVIVAIRLTGTAVDRIGLGFFRGEFGTSLVFLALFLSVFTIAVLGGALLAKLWEGKSPGALSRVVGFLVGALRGYLLVVVLGGAVVLLASDGSPMLARSRALPLLGPGIEGGARLLPDDLGANLERKWLAIPFRPTWKDGGVAI